MFGIGGLFKKIQSSFVREIAVRQVIAAAIKNHVGIEVPIEKMNIVGGVVTLKSVSGAARSTLYIKKQAILKEIGESPLDITIGDIK